MRQSIGLRNMDALPAKLNTTGGNISATLISEKKTVIQISTSPQSENLLSTVQDSSQMYES